VEEVAAEVVNSGSGLLTGMAADWMLGVTLFTSSTSTAVNLQANCQHNNKQQSINWCLSERHELRSASYIFGMKLARHHMRPNQPIISHCTRHT
jgi:hypothetical protein